MNSFKLIIAALVLQTSLHAGAQVSVQEKLRTDLDGVIHQYLQDEKIVGNVVVVVQDGKVIYEKASGFADREAKKPMTLQTSFRLASMSKPLVAVTTLKLVDEGKFKLDDPVTKYIPSFKPRMSDGSAPVITIKNLLTHTAGLNYGFFEAKDGPYHKLKISDGMDISGITLEENVRRIGEAALLYKPGTQWQYSLSIDVLGLVLEKAMGKTLPQLVHDKVTGPLAMAHTHFWIKNLDVAFPYTDGKPPQRMGRRAEVPFGESAIVFSPQRAFSKNEFPSGGAGMIGTAKDYSKFLEAIRNATLIKSNDLCLKNQVGDMQVSAAGKGWGWSLCASYLKDAALAGSPQKEGTIKWGGAYGHTWWIDPTAKLSVIILTNTAFEGMSGSFPDKIRDTIYANLK